jgi:hypothetical protein
VDFLQDPIAHGKKHWRRAGHELRKGQYGRALADIFGLIPL